jgi:tetratricopeptide (TPR) repeat protein
VGTASAEEVHRYALGEVLGEGGMGVVYSAFDAVRGHVVALKRLSAAALSDAQRERVIALFEREYHTLSQLTHPQIIAVYDYGIDEHGPYYTMERLSGHSLKTLAPLPWVDACRLLRDAASALAVLHSRRLVHRDVTPANIQLALDGRAKLIDFGAMAPAGLARQVVGTAPFIAPECLQLQALDARTDIYSLGACLYFALTGRHAYPARNMRDLPQAWKALPPRLAELGKDVPEALERLVLDMLRLDVSQRPRGIGEVFERLTAIAGLPRIEGADAARAYLINPELVGRDGELERLARRIRHAVRGQGRSLLVQGAPGLGRSRLLDAAAFEARLRGLTVLRAHAGDGQGAALGVARRLLAALLEERPELAPELEAAGLGALVRGHSGLHLLDNRERERVIEAFGGVVIAASAGRPLAIVVDDVDAVDEPSCACLASLAAQLRGRAIALVTSAQLPPAAGASSVLPLLEESSQKIGLAPLDEREARAFLASLFGEVPNLELLALIARRACGGSPGQLMDGAQEVVRRGLARYEGGHWLISSDPEALEAALSAPTDPLASLDRLSADAIDLLEALALDRDRIMGLADFPALTAHGDSRRVNHALTELVAAGALIAADDRFGFARERLRELVTERMEPAARRARHERLAERCTVLGVPPIYEAYHFLRAELFVRAAPGIDAFAEFIERYPGADIVRNPLVLDALEATVTAPDATFDRAFLANHGAGYVINAIYQGRPERAIDHAPDMLQALSWFTGLSEYHALAGCEPGERLTRALTVAQQRCEQAARPGFDVVQAIRRQAQLSLTTAVCARFMAEPALLAAIPDLMPYVPLSPALGLVARLTDAVAKFVRGRDFEAWDVVRAVRAELRGPAIAAIDPLTRLSLEHTTLVLLCSLEAEYGTDHALAYAEELAPRMPNLAESIRARYHYVRGDLAAADAARHRFEVLSVQANSLSDARILELPIYLTLHALASDLMGLTRTLHALEQVARTRPKWQARVRLARGHVLRCRGEIGAALAEVEQALLDLEPSHGDWAALAALHATLLDQEGRHALARDAAEHYLEQARAHGLHAIGLELALAVACAELGDATAAERCFESAHAALRARGATGLHMRHCLDVGARIAVRRHDQGLFAERTRASNGQVARRSLFPCEPRWPQTSATSSSTSSSSWSLAPTAGHERTRVMRFEAALSRLARGASRHAGMLQLLCDHVEASSGALYLARGSRIERVAVTVGLEDLAGLDAEIAALHARELTSSAEATVAGGSDSDAGWTALHARAVNERTLIPYSLIAERGGIRQLVGMAVLAFEHPEDAAVAHGWLTAMASALDPPFAT